MHRQSSLDFLYHKVIELYHIFLFLLFSECSETFEDCQTGVDHSCHDSEEYHLISERDGSSRSEEIFEVFK